MNLADNVDIHSYIYKLAPLRSGASLQHTTPWDT